MDSSVNYDASPPRDAGCWSDDPEGTSDHPMPGNQVRRGSEQPDRGCWMPWGSGAEKTDVKSALVTNVHRGHAHQSTTDYFPNHPYCKLWKNVLLIRAGLIIAVLFLVVAYLPKHHSFLIRVGLLDSNHTQVQYQPLPI